VPLHRLATTTEQAARAFEFVQWVKEQWLTEDGKQHPNIFIFDFFSLAAEMSLNPVNGKQYCLKYDYEYSHTSSDSHPNTLANATIGPLFAQAAVKVLTTNYHLTNIAIKAQNGSTSIDTDNGTLQLQTEVLPVDALNKSVNWSVIDLTGMASISASGLMTAQKNGTVKAVASATDGSGIKGELMITISNQVIHVENISVSSAGGTTTITSDNGTLQLAAAVLPADATSKSVSWSVVNITGMASISTSGIVTAEKNGTVKAIATAIDGSGIQGELSISISNQIIPVQSISIIDNLKNDTITGIGINLILKTLVTPSDATDSEINWSLENQTGKANINSDGILTTISTGSILVKAQLKNDASIFSQKKYIIVFPTLNQPLKENSYIQIFPNPTSEKININTKLVQESNLWIEIRDVRGALIMNSKFTSENIEIETNKWKAGIYILKVFNAKICLVYRVVKQ
jgi:uncharacterized protein YjdB